MAAEAKVVHLQLKINGENAFNTFKDLNEHVGVLRKKLNTMAKDDPSYQQVAQKLRDCVEKQKAWREEIYGTQKANKGFLDDFKSNLGGLVSSFSIVTLAINGIQSAIGGLTAFFSGAQASFVEGEQTQAQLAAAIKSTGSAASRTRDQLNELSAALMAQTGINSDNIAKAEALLLTFTNIRSEIYDQTLPIMLDMNKALGQSLESSAIQLGKALNDPIRGFSALAEVGVSFSTTQREIITNFQNSGDLASAQKVILEELAKEFGGVAKAMAQTDSGKLEVFGTRMVKIQENIGGMITSFKAANLSVFEPFVGWLEKVTATKMADKIKAEHEELNGLVSAIVMTNQNQEVRNRLIDELQAKYPDFLGKLKAEEVSNELLTRRLKEANEQYRLKLFMAANEDKIKEIQEKRSKAIKEEAEARRRVAEYTGLSAEALAKLNDEQIKDLALKQRGESLKNLGLNAVVGGTRAVVTDGLDYLRGKGALRAIADVELIVNGRKKLAESLKEEGDLLKANTVLAEKAHQEEIKAIDEEIAKFKQMKTAHAEAEIKRLTEQRNGLLGITPPIQKPGKTQEQLKAEAAERKKREDELKADLKQTQSEFEKLGTEFDKQRLDSLYKTLSANEKEVQAEKDKYAGLIAEQQKFLEHKNISPEQREAVEKQITGLKSQSDASISAIRARQEKERLEEIQNLRSQLTQVHQSELEKEQLLIRNHYAKLKEQAHGNAEAIQFLEICEAEDSANAKIREEQRFQQENKKIRQEFSLQHGTQVDRDLAAIHAKYDAQLEALKQRFGKELQLTQEFHNLQDAINAQRDQDVTKKKAENARLQTEQEISNAKETKDFACQMAHEISDATFSIAASNRQAETNFILDEINRQRQEELANKDLTEEQKKAINDKYDKKIRAEKLRAWIADKEAAKTQAIINGIVAVTKVIHNPFLAALAGAAALAQVIKIESQPAPKFAGGGFIPVGPSHQAGGIALINPNGHKVGEIEGGEPILSKETYRNNKQLIDTLLYSSQRLNGARVVVNTSEIMQASRIYRNGGFAASSTGSNLAMPADLSELISEVRLLQAAVREEKMRPVEFNYRVFEDFQERVNGVRVVA
ncbi:MAG: hypothetical protein E6Q66_04605 [Pedobacter sp.]|nr:MAG: hypothetical protein E6Q66_04605 [Pedobacter sp.]